MAIVQYSYSNSVSVDQDCIIAANALRFSKGPDKIKFIIFKITDDEQNVVVEETSSETDYEVFRQKLLSGVDKTGNPAPRYAVYDVDYDLGEDGKRQLRMLYASTMEYLKKTVNAGVFTHAGNQEDIEWEELVKTGTDNTFQEFPYDLKKAVGKELPDCKVQSVVYPKYETSGELAQASEGFLGWLKERVMDIRKEKSEKPWPPHDRDVGVVLVAHSMGGFVAADSLFLAINERANDGDENDPLFPLIQGILTFDTPYNGLARSMFVYGAFSNYQKVNSVFNVMTAISAAAPASLARLSARRAATTAVTTTTRGPQWKTWQLVAVKTGTVGAIAAGGVAAYMNRELIMQGMKSVKNINKESVAEGYRQSMDAFGQGLAYINRGNVGRSFSWLSDHVTFVGALLRQKELNRRLERIGSLKGVGIHDFYCSLGENGYWSGGYFVPERTFCAIPEESHSAYPIFERCVMPKADDEVEAHMNMFRPEKHRGYEEMTERSAELVKKWFMSEDNVVDDPKFRETPPEETEETEKAKEILEKDPGAEENEKAEGADKDKDDEFPDESPLDIANAASLVPLPDDTGDQLIGDANIEGANTVEKRNYLNYLFGVAQSAGTDAKGWLPNKIPQMPNLPSMPNMPNMPNMPKVPSSVSSLGNVSMPSMRIWGKKDGDTQGEGETQDKNTTEEKNDTAEVETKAEPKETTDNNAEVAQKIEAEGEKKSAELSQHERRAYQSSHFPALYLSHSKRVMLKLEERFFALEGSIYPGGPSTWYIMDSDQRRLVSVTMDEELESVDTAVEHLSNRIDDLELDVFEIHVSSQGDLISTSTDLEDDNTFCPFYAPLEAIEEPGDIQVVPRSKLQELDRLGPLVDLVTDLQSSKPRKRLVFKYHFVYQRMSRVWNEMNMWMCLPKHPNIVPFDKIVIDELEGRCVGFTTKYIEGGTLDENRSRVFKLKWLLQLIAIMDELNLNLGVAH
ncbi:unnamed protein product [Fusarium graminearum]|nr:unnamed protein product [Fusarium graminearum]